MIRTWLLIVFLLGRLQGSIAQHGESMWRAIASDSEQVKRFELAPGPWQHTWSDSLMMTLPTLEGKMCEFIMQADPLLPVALAAKFPRIRTYTLEEPESGRIVGRASLTPLGFHGMYRLQNRWLYLDPMPGEVNQYELYTHERPRRTVSHICHLIHADPTKPQLQAVNSTGALRTYRLAVAATGEYTAFHGGVTNALAAITQTINRVNAITIQDLGIRFTLVADNDRLIYADSLSDPYENVDPSQRLTANQTILDRTLGVNGYDIGHVFATRGGGLASRASVCVAARKAQGTTGLPNPIGDAFDVDFVAHELGHQLGANHTFNAITGLCSPVSRNAATAFEPGSGSTIMGYAGICSPNNLQVNSDPYFHTGSLSEIFGYTVSGEGNSCGLLELTGNTPPAVEVPDTVWTIPRMTPFFIQGQGLDVDGDQLTYTWEQINLGPAGNAGDPQGNAPIFRSFGPDSSARRYFPRLEDLLANRSNVGEVLPDYERTLQFRLTARDNQATGGCVGTADMAVKVSQQAGPFAIIPQSTAHDWIAGSFQRLQWEVALTDQFPVNCRQVDVILDQGAGIFDDTLVQHIPNTGQYILKVPPRPTTDYRLMIAGANHLFFAISADNFQITNPPVGFDLFPVMDTLVLCEGIPNTLQILTTSLGGYTGGVSFVLDGSPNGLNLTLDSTQFVLGDTLDLFAAIEPNLPTGNYSVTLRGEGENGFVVVRTIIMAVNKPESLAKPSLIWPQDGADGQSIRPSFNWQDLPEAASFTWEISDNPTFRDAQSYTIGVTHFQPTVALDTQQVYFWRVRGANVCQSGPTSPISSFKTGACVIAQSTNVPEPIPDIGTARSQLSLTWIPPIRDINVYDLIGQHPSINQLSLVLENPLGEEAFLTVLPCSPLASNFDMGFDDEAQNLALDCPPTENRHYRPFQSLATLAMTNPMQATATGTWQLNILDQFEGAQGSLISWGLEICGGPAPTPFGLNQRPLVVLPQGSAFLTSDLLTATIPELPAQEIVYTLVSIPAEGILQLLNEPLVVGATFTQEDINQGRLGYDHTGQGVLDSFRFVVQGPNGAYLGTPTFIIQIGPTHVKPKSAFPISVAPNPVSDRIQVGRKGRPMTGTFSIWNLVGQRVEAYEVTNQETISIDLNPLTPGMYLLHYRGEQESEKWLLQKQ